jgi:hypothetical protein
VDYGASTGANVGFAEQCWHLAEMIVRAAADTKPLSTGMEIKSRMNPSLKSPINSE